MVLNLVVLRDTAIYPMVYDLAGVCRTITSGITELLQFNRTLLLQLSS